MAAAVPDDDDAGGIQAAAVMGRKEKNESGFTEIHRLIENRQITAGEDSWPFLLQAEQMGRSISKAR